MSHFTVLVIGDAPEAQLAPFQENNMGDCPREYMEFTDTEDEMRGEYETEATGAVRMPDGTIVHAYDDRFMVEETDDKSPFPRRVKKIPDDLTEEEIPNKEMYATFEAYVREAHGHKARDPEKKRYGYWENPNCKWDWYVLGGRYTGMFMLKPGATSGSVGETGVFGTPPRPGMVDRCQVKDIDWDATLGDVRAQRREYWKETEAKRKKAEEMNEDPKQVAGYLDMVFGVKPDDTEETYVARAYIGTFAVLKDGTWYERGQMGWWGVVIDETDHDEWMKKWWELVTGLDGETWVHVYDCHI